MNKVCWPHPEGDGQSWIIDLHELVRVLRESPKGAERLPVALFSTDPAIAGAIEDAERPNVAEALAAKIEAGAELTADERRQAAALLRRQMGRPRRPPARVLTRDLIIWLAFQRARARGLGYDDAIEAAEVREAAAGLDSAGVRAAVTRVNKLMRRDSTKVP